MKATSTPTRHGPPPQDLKAGTKGIHFLGGMVIVFSGSQMLGGGWLLAINREDTMTKQKKLKRLVRARMAKTNEGFAAARLQLVQRERPRFEAVIRKTLQLARRAQQEAAEEDRGSGSDYLDSDAILRRLTRQVPPHKQALLSYLDRQSEVDAIKLQTVMYVGRDGDDVPTTHKQLASVTDDKADAIRTMISKSPLPDYLERGLRAIKSTDIDLDADWATLLVTRPDHSEARPVRRRAPRSDLRPLPCEICGKDLLSEIGMSMLLMAGVMTDSETKIRGVMFVCKNACDRAAQELLGIGRNDTIDLWYELYRLGQECDDLLSIREWPPELAAKVRRVAEMLP